MTRQWLDEHVELYAVDSLPAAEQDDFEAELIGLDPATRRAYEDRIEEVRDLMHDYSEQYSREAPELLRARVLADFDSGVRHPRTEHDGRRRRMAAMVSIAAASIAVAVGAGVIIGRTTAPDSAPTTTAQGDAAAAVFSAPDAVLSTATLSDSRGALSVVSSKSLNRAVATVRGVVDPVPADHALQLWMVEGGRQPVSAGLFTGSAATPLVVEGLGATQAFAVTLEPSGGSPSPTLPLLAQVKI